MFKNILVAIDGSESSARAFEVAAGLSEKFGAGLHLLHVVREMQVPLYPGIMEEYEKLLRQRHDVLNTAGEQLLNQTKRVAKSKGVPSVETFVASGDPATAIVEHAAKQKIDLIVLGSRGLGRVTGMLMGSVSRKVSNTTGANCLIIK